MIVRLNCDSKCLIFFCYYSMVLFCNSILCEIVGLHRNLLNVKPVLGAVWTCSGVRVFSLTRFKVSLWLSDKEQQFLHVPLLFLLYVYEFVSYCMMCLCWNISLNCCKLIVLWSIAPQKVRFHWQIITQNLIVVTCLFSSHVETIFFSRVGFFVDGKVINETHRLL